MILWQPIRCGALAVLCGLAWGGCSPAGPGVTDERKEPQYLIGQSRVGVMDFGGAVEAFQKAVETNPRSAAAHFQLGSLYADRVPDPAAAIYHYQQFLRWRPTGTDAEMARAQIPRLKQKVAQEVLLLPVPGEQRQVEELRTENRQLHKELEGLRNELAARVAATNPPSTRIIQGGRAANHATAAVAAMTGATPKSPTPSPPRAASASSGMQTHKVVAGDTLTAIARRYRIKVEALLAANPNLNPKRMRVDQSLIIPAR